MSDTGNLAVAAAEELAELRREIARLAIIQAGGMHALADLARLVEQRTEERPARTLPGTPRYTPFETVRMALSAAEGSLEIVKRLLDTTPLSSSNDG